MLFQTALELFLICLFVWFVNVFFLFFSYQFTSFYYAKKKESNESLVFVTLNVICKIRSWIDKKKSHTLKIVNEVNREKRIRDKYKMRWKNKNNTYPDVQLAVWWMWMSNSNRLIQLQIHWPPIQIFHLIL